jgi:membrane-bound lytic murein transglycosylase D
LQRFLETARAAVIPLPSRLLIGAVSLLLAAGCSTITPPATEGSDSGAIPVAVSESSRAPEPAGSQAPAIADAAPAVQERPRWTGRDETALPGNLWDRIRAGFAMPELDTSLVADKERFYLQRPDYLQRMFDRGGRYLFHIVEEIEKRGMPTELALLPFVESAMNPVALSHAKAAGLWQFIPSTGKAFNLDQNWWVDNRRDVVKSTEAALDYLQKIYEMHGNDWFLALASYNWGEGAVGRAVKRNRARGLPADYLSLQMPAETRHYVPKLIALKRIVQRADQLGLKLPDLPNRPYFVTIEKTRPIDLKLAARFAGMTVDEFVALNPAHNRPVISASRNNEIKLPADRVDAFVDAVEKHGRNNRAFATWQPYTLKAGETLESLASRAGISVAELRDANDLRASARILPGTRLLSPHRQVEDETRVEEFNGPRVYELVERPAVYHVVRPRESLVSIARRYGTSVASLRELNGLNKAVAPRGARLLIRPANSQTLLTTESGDRRVVAQSEARIVRAVVRETGPAEPVARPNRATTKATAPAPATKAPVKAATRKAAPRPVAQPKPAARNAGSGAKTPVARNGSGKRT